MKGQRRTLKFMQDVATERGGACLSERYKHGRALLHWRCKDGHEWKAPSNSIMQGAWCPTCAGRPHYTLFDMQDWAESHNGFCLSTEYVNSTTPLKWQCAHGHTFDKPPAQIRQGAWCPTCTPRGRKPLTLEDMQALATERHGAFVSTAYHGVEVKHRWRCAKGHEWDALPKNVRQGSWCPTCANAEGASKRAANPARARTPGSLSAMQAVATSRGGACLSTDYRNNYSDLRWRCKEDHEWKAKPYNVQRGSWCPTCAGRSTSGGRGTGRSGRLAGFGDQTRGAAKISGFA